ncbi:MAG: hypothetical protein R8G66_08480 [Cytophagales bacterium]|nr:hypothetical protein [Cytophagales bacterium]
MAYSSAITICGGQDIYMNSNNWVSFIPLVLSVVVLGMIFLNQRGIKTWIALLIALLSATLIVLSHQLIVPSTFYNVGGIGLLMAAWLNGNLWSFIHQVVQKIRNSRILYKRQITYPIDQK